MGKRDHRRFLNHRLTLHPASLAMTTPAQTSQLFTECIRGRVSLVIVIEAQQAAATICSPPASDFLVHVELVKFWKSETKKRTKGVVSTFLGNCALAQRISYDEQAPSCQTLTYLTGRDVRKIQGSGAVIADN